MAGSRVLLWGAAGEALVTSEVLSEGAREVLLEAFGAITQLTFKEWEGRGGPKACQASVLTRIAMLLGKAAVEARFPGLEITLPGEAEPPKEGP